MGPGRGPSEVLRPARAPEQRGLRRARGAAREAGRGLPGPAPQLRRGLRRGRPGAFQLAAKYVGGVRLRRDHVGDPGGRLPFEPVAKAQQQEALALLREHLFSPRAFQFSPQLLNKLAAERWPNWRDFDSMLGRLDYPVHARVLTLQQRVLDRLLHPVVLSRIQDAGAKDADPFSLSLLFDGLKAAIWEETKSPAGTLAINSYRRSLQRDHLKRLVRLVLAGEGNPRGREEPGAREPRVSPGTGEGRPGTAGPPDGGRDPGPPRRNAVAARRDTEGGGAALGLLTRPPLCPPPGSRRAGERSS